MKKRIKQDDGVVVTTVPFPVLPMVKSFCVPARIKAAALPLLLSIACFLPVQAESDSSLFGTEAERLVSRGMRHYNNQDYGSAFRCFRQAAETGDAYAQYNLALCYHKGEGVEKDLREAKMWYREAAEQGYVYAQYSLAEFCRCGDGGEKDMSEAVKWYRAAAQQGHPGAQYSLGTCYANGQGVFKDVAEAEKWYRKAAEQGDETSREALRKLGKEKKMAEAYALVLVQKGREFVRKKKYGQAVECLRKAAEQGNADAQLALAACYEFGRGTKKNREKARYWYEKAAEKGHYRAKQKVQEMGWE